MPTISHGKLKKLLPALQMLYISHSSQPRKAPRDISVLVLVRWNRTARWRLRCSRLHASTGPPTRERRWRDNDTRKKNDSDSHVSP